jgi:hypothetical protein
MNAESMGRGFPGRRAQYDASPMSLSRPVLRIDLRSRRSRRWRGLPRWCAPLALVAVAAYAGHEVACTPASRA